MSTGTVLSLLVNSRGCGITLKNGKGTNSASFPCSMSAELMEEGESGKQGLPTI